VVRIEIENLENFESAGKKKEALSELGPLRE